MTMHVRGGSFYTGTGLLALDTDHSARICRVATRVHASFGATHTRATQARTSSIGISSPPTCLRQVMRTSFSASYQCVLCLFVLFLNECFNFNLSFHSTHTKKNANSNTYECQHLPHHCRLSCRRRRCLFPYQHELTLNICAHPSSNHFTEFT